MADPSHPLAQELLRHPTFDGEKGTAAELQSLYESAQYFADILERWNSDGAELQDIFVTNGKAG